MIKLKSLLNNIWIRLFLYLFLAIFILIFVSKAFGFFLISPNKQDVKNAQQGMSRNQIEFSRLQNEVNSIQQKVETKSKSSTGMYEHYYALYTNPVRYINQYVLSESKPEALIILTSSVMPNVNFSSSDRAKFKPHIKQFGISNTRSLNSVYSVYAVRLTATGSFPVIGQYLTNLNALPLKFSIKTFKLKESNNSLTLELEMAFFVYKIESKKP